MAKGICNALVGGEAEPGRSPAAEIGKGGGLTDFLHFFQRKPGAKTCADQGADTGTGYTVDRNPSIAKCAQYANVRDAAREASSQRQADFRASAAFGTVAAMGEFAKFIFRDAQPLQSFADFAIQHADFILSCEAGHW
jgi:hypothetical protein